MPDGTLLIRCGNRRAAACPGCAREYAGDMWQLVYAGLVGDRKGVPGSVATHPAAFVTLTAPGFGPVHTTPTDNGGRPGPCRPRTKKALCLHGRPTWCTRRHADDDPRLGEPLCGDATTTSEPSCSTGARPNCGGGSTSPCVAISPTSLG
jgi:hypothetical protein